jgi:hypothetical protein
MEYLNSIRAALKATAPVVAIPLEGHAPICIRRKLLAGVLKGVTIDSVQASYTGTSYACVTITGHAGRVHTSCKLIGMNRVIALKEIREWSIKEREKKIMRINQGVLSAQAQRELKKKQIENEPSSELKKAMKEVDGIYHQAKEHVVPAMDYVSEDQRQDVMQEYASFRRSRHLRKHGAVIRWKIAQLRAELDKITVKKGGRRESKKTYARKAKDAPKMLLMMRQIAALEEQFKGVYPLRWSAIENINEDGGFWVDSWTTHHPIWQTCQLKESWRSEDRYDRQSLARQLKETRADIRSLTPPKDEQEELPIAA